MNPAYKEALDWANQGEKARATGGLGLFDEWPGADQDNPNIVQCFKDLGLTWFTHDSTPHCMVCLMWLFKRHGYRYVRSARAIEAAGLGSPVTAWDLRPGDVLIIKWHEDPANLSGHVGFFHAWGDPSLSAMDNSHVQILGFNQNDQLRITSYPWAKVRAMMRPLQGGLMPVNKQAAQEVIEGAKAYQIADTWPPPQTESQELAPQETPPLTRPRGHPEFDPSLDGILSGSRTRIAGWLAGGLGLVGSGLAWLNDNTGLLLGVLILAVITGALLNSFALAKIAKLIRKQTTILKGGRQ